MKIILEYLSLGVLSLLLSLLYIPIIKRIAVKINLVDTPNLRKIHTSNVPLIGGVSIVFTTLTVILISGNCLYILKEYLSIFSAAFTVLILGIIDDKNDIRPKYKLAIQLILSFIIALSGIRIFSFYGVFGVYEIAIWLQYAITILVITGVVNAFNLIDGVDGLLGSLSLLGFTMFLLASIYYNDYYLGIISVIFIGAIIGFLRFNLSPEKIFMGDSGSLFLGFTLVTLGIQLMGKQDIQKEYNYQYVFLVLVAFFSIPVLDSLRVYMGRIKRGKSPFLADKSHLHHLLLGAGLTHKKIALTVIILCLVFFFLGFGLITSYSTTLIIFSIMLVFWIIIRLLLVINNLQKWIRIIKEIEKQNN
ncbi:undecaprenyl/decaprenyl-phosphate alpha-N-acetylglucosaminyl 1-phosphate transferase [Flavobacterium sp. ZT3R18]|uniref:MraY family glycosyltransferase n=1 Tax=Flavobacterium sp. ZT3R18 TaxID=2594429 RepID=UPI00117AD2F8|nr:MraY family glycosyltransferase [Flavobacterium sp. ZT3R18]TRX36161.1 undecaprenyl/decaprenyl-phosphate alpha-N-acetylglucosaminyl 1-phosphate transferase [Flavobacterium sp. ZT3R18]